MSDATEQKTISAIIVDDEVAARFNIRDALKDHPHWTIVGEATNGNEGLALVISKQPMVVFLDIQMPFIDGISLAKKLAQSDYCPVIIFVTAYDNYAVQAFELYAMDYLLKPFDNARFASAIKRVEQSLSSFTDSHEIRQRYNHYDENKHIQRLIIRSAASIRIVNIQDVYWFSTESNYVAIHHRQGVHLHRISLSFLEQRLDSSIFTRTHRTAIVRLDQCVEIKTLTEHKSLVILANGDQVSLSKAYRESLLTYLGG
jgi:two-component system LytT family response regulator